MAVRTENTTDTINGLSICAGIGGLDLALDLVLPAYRTVCFVERDAACAANLVDWMEKGVVDHAPIWDDLTTFYGSPWRGCVDIVSAGLPCQPYSCAGKRLGWADERSHGILPHFVRIVSECRPAMVFIENVPAFVTAGHFRRLGEELCGLGYSWEEPLFVSAAQVGASHKRERVFLLAHAERQRSRQPAGNTDTAQESLRATERGEGASRDGSGSEHVGDGESNPRGQRIGKHGHLGDGSGSIGIEAKCGKTEGLGYFTPGPGAPEWEAIIERRPDLAPALPAESEILRAADGVPAWRDRLRLLGNSVVPLAAAYAFSTLLDEAINKPVVPGAESS